MSRSALEKIARIRRKRSLGHVIGRAIEYLLLQTRPTAAVYRPIARRYYRFRYGRHLRSRDCPIDPFKQLTVDPHRIERFTPRTLPSLHALYDIGRIEGGDWDLDDPAERKVMWAESVEETPLYLGFVERFVDGRDWEETTLYRTAAELIRSGDRAWRSESIEELDDRCQRVDELYEEMREHGYRSQRKLAGVAPNIDEPFGFLNEQINEVAVDIARDGELLLVDNRHRLALARVLDIDTIPVTVIVRHEQWVETICPEPKSDVSDHPDVIANDLH